MSARLALTALLASLAACADVSVIDVQAAACLQLEECLPDVFSAQYASQQLCVDDYDNTTSVCYDLHCTYDSRAAATCKADIEAQPCGEILNEIDSCRPEAVWEDCDTAALDACLLELEGS
jgi:hypothetical protein